MTLINSSGLLLLHEGVVSSPKLATYFLTIYHYVATIFNKHITKINSVSFFFHCSCLYKHPLTLQFYTSFIAVIVIFNICIFTSMSFPWTAVKSIFLAQPLKLSLFLLCLTTFRLLFCLRLLFFNILILFYFLVSDFLSLSFLSGFALNSPNVSLFTLWSACSQIEHIPLLFTFQ